MNQILELFLDCIKQLDIRHTAKNVCKKVKVIVLMIALELKE